METVGSKRQLAAIMFTDIVGYTALMAQVEDKALDVVSQNNEIQKSIAKKYEGQLHKELGDGTLFSFSSSLKAVECAIEIQRQVAQKADYQLRIGVHLGDVTFRDGDVFGDGVNIAARLESIAVPGGICVSDSIYRSISNQSDVDFKNFGQKKLKNIDEEVQTYLIHADGIESLAHTSRKKNTLQIMIPVGAVLLLILGYLIGSAGLFDPVVDKEVIKANILLPADQPFEFIGSAPLNMGRPNLTIAPDGKTVVYLSKNNGTPILIKRELKDFEGTIIQGTENAYNPKFSPDGMELAFFSNGELKLVNLSGTQDKVLGEITNPYGMTWISKHEIVVSNNEGRRLLLFDTRRMNAIPTPLSPDNNSSRFLWPTAIEGRKKLVSGSYVMQLKYLDINSNTVEVLSPRFSKFITYLPTGHLLFVHHEDMYITEYDVSTQQLSDEPSEVLDNVRIETHSAPQLAFSNNGTLVYASGLPVTKSQFIVLDKDGNENNLGLSADQYGTFELTSDKKNILTYTLWEDRTINALDMERRISTPHNFDNPVTFTAMAISKDDRYFYTVESSNDSHRIVRKSTTSDVSEILYESSELILVNDVNASHDVWLIMMKDNIYALQNGSDLIPVAASGGNEWGARFSPDGKRFAYTSDETGQYEIFVKDYPATESKWQISTNGGEEPVWINDHKVIYRNEDTWNIVELSETAGGIKIGSAQPAFNGNFLNPPGHSYDVIDENHILVLKPLDPRTNTHSLNLVYNWFAEIESIQSDSQK